MMTSSILEPMADHNFQYSDSKNDYHEEGNANSASKSNAGLLDETFDVADSSMMVAEETLYDEDISYLDKSGRKSLGSPTISPKRSRHGDSSSRLTNNLNRVVLKNEMG